MRTSNNLIRSELCVLHDEVWLRRQRIAGKIAAKTLSLLENLVANKTIKSLIELDAIAEEFIVSNGCSPTFKNYKKFPNSVCMSVDNEKSHALVHGIPNEYVLQDGDLISFDLGATYEGAIADTAITCIYGAPKSDKHLKLIQDTEESLMLGINAISVGKRIGVIGRAIYKFLSSKSYGVITQYGGHSLTYNTPHASPFVANKATADEGIVISSGMTLAIEPMAVIDSRTKTVVGKDNWTVYSENTSCHFEHSVFVHKDHVEIITARA